MRLQHWEKSVRTEATELVCTADKDCVGTDRKHLRTGLAPQSPSESDQPRRSESPIFSLHGRHAALSRRKTTLLLSVSLGQELLFSPSAFSPSAWSIFLSLSFFVCCSPALIKADCSPQPPTPCSAPHLQVTSGSRTACIWAHGPHTVPHSITNCRQWNFSFMYKISPHFTLFCVFPSLFCTFISVQCCDLSEQISEMKIQSQNKQLHLPLLFYLLFTRAPSSIHPLTGCV